MPRRARRAVLFATLAGAAVLPFALDAFRPPDVEPRPNPVDVVDQGTIGRDGSLYRSLAALGLPKSELGLIDAAFRKTFDDRRSRPDDAYELRRSTDGAVREIRYWPDPLKYVFIRRDADGRYAASVRGITLEASSVGAYGKIETSLWDAMIAQGIPPEVIMRFTEIFAWQVDFLTEPRPGDTFKLVWTRRQSDRTSIDGDILFAQYFGAAAGNRSAVLFAGGYYDLDGVSLRRQFLRAPLNFRRISSYYTGRRYHPILRRYRPHHGIDYAAAYGTPVVAVGDGVVTTTGWKGGNGRMIEVRHNSSYASIYGHLSRYAAGVRPGRRVHQGQVIGYVGSTGLSTGPHLHFGFKRNGSLVNFLGMKLPSTLRVRERDRSAFGEAKNTALIQLAELRDLGRPPLAVRPPEQYAAAGASK